MTCREKLAMEHPEAVVERLVGGCEGCPHEYGYLSDPDWCGSITMGLLEACTKCWDREIPGEENEKKQPEGAKACYTCDHRHVCKFEGQYATLMDSLKDCQFIRPERIMCVYYKPSYKKEV